MEVQRGPSEETTKQPARAAALLGVQKQGRESGLCGLVVATGWTGGHPAVFGNSLRADDGLSNRDLAMPQAAFMQSDMNFLRSSAFMPFDFVLQAAILLSDAFFLSDRQVLMNFLRSSPFFSPASLLHAFIRSCCAFSAASTGVATAANAPNRIDARNFFKGTPQEK